jgi:hypothetical protein
MLLVWLYSSVRVFVSLNILRNPWVFKKLAIIIMSLDAIPP